MFGSDHDHDTHLHQVDEVGPDRLLLFISELNTGTVGRNTLAEKDFRAVGVADAG
ncbi:MAG: hypothetical protein JWN03_8113 [Nocardia sp.]|nr:hypothetical protein [Nocardia sp.]